MNIHEGKDKEQIYFNYGSNSFIKTVCAILVDGIKENTRV